MSMEVQNLGGPEPVEPAGMQKHKKKAGFVFLLLLVAGLAVWGYFYYRHAMEYEETDDAFIDGHITPVSAKVSGQVCEVLVKDNQEVDAGAVLVRIDPRDLQAKLDQAKAALEAAVTRLTVANTAVELTKANTDAQLAEAIAGEEQAKASVSSAESQLASAQADVVAATAEALRRDTDMKRYSALERGAVSPQVLDAAKAALDTANAALDAARKRATAAEAKIAEQKAKLLQAQAGVRAAQTAPQQVASTVAQAQTATAAINQAKAMVAAAELDLSYTEVRAAVAGRVTRKSVQLGQFVQAGQTMLAMVQPDVWVVANFKETQMARMHEGQEVGITIDAYPGKNFHGTIQSIQAGAGSRFSLLPPENATGNYVKVVQRIPVKIVFDAAEESSCLLAPGMSVVPHVRVGDQAGVAPAAIRGSAKKQASLK